MAEQLRRKDVCPFLRKPCIGADCKLYVQLSGTDPQTGAAIDGWDCAFVWNIQALLDVRRTVGSGLTGVQAATESFRNEVIRRQDEMPPTLAVEYAEPRS
jgi:hypothetical protein